MKERTPEGRLGGVGGEHLRSLCSLREVQQGCQRVPEPKWAARVSPRNGPALVFLHSESLTRRTKSVAMDVCSSRDPLSTSLPIVGGVKDTFSKP